MTDERKCPKCGQSEEFYPRAVPDGFTPEGLVRLKVTDGGHCLHCGWDSEDDPDAPQPATDA